jgi:hypothetical protein
MSRLNQLLEPLSVDQARGGAEEGEEGPLRVFALHELDSLDADEGALLARMVQDLPGARIALLILAYRRRRLPEALEQSFRRGLRSWSIPVPPNDALETFESEAEAQGFGDEVAPLLIQLRRERLVDSFPSLDEESSGADLDAQVDEDGSEATPTVSQRTKAPALVRWPFLLAAGLTALALIWWYGVGQEHFVAPGDRSSPFGELSTK